MSKVCDKCVDFRRCRDYCSYKAGESLVLMIANMPTVSSKIGMPINHGKVNSSFDTTNYKYCGALLSEGSGKRVTDLAREASKFKPFGNPFSSYSGITVASMINNFLNLNYANADGSKEFTKNLMDKYYKLIQGNELPLTVPVGSEITMRFKLDGKTRQERGKVTSLAWRPDEETGKIRLSVGCTTKVGGQSISVTYEPEDFYEKYTVDKNELSLKNTIKTSGIFGMTDSGYLMPIKIDDGRHVFYLDGHNLIYEVSEDEHKIIGSFTMQDTFEETKATFGNYKTSDAYRAAKKIIPLVQKERWFILPYGVAEEHRLDAVKYIEESKKISATKE